MSTPHSKPGTLDELLANLAAVRDDLGKGGRRLAIFLMENPQAAALLPSTEIARRCGVHASTVVRLAQGVGLSGYRELQAIAHESLSSSLGENRKSALAPPAGEAAGPLRLVLLAESGRSFNEASRSAAARFAAENPAVEIETELHVSHTVDPTALAGRIAAVAQEADGLILVAREHPAINGAVREVTAKGLPVVCLTSDLPSSGRSAYVGSDQFSSGSTAGWFCGRFLPRGEPGQVLFVGSVPFRSQLDREQGFRQVLRSEFPALVIDEKVSSDESAEVVYDAVRRYVATNGAPAAIYNVSGANLGIGRALEAEGLAGRTVFIGHELNDNSRSLLQKGVMDLAIGHDFDLEMATAVDCIRSARLGVQPAGRLTQSLIFTRHNCALA